MVKIKLTTKVPQIAKTDMKRNTSKIEILSLPLIEPIPINSTSHQNKYN